MKYDKKYSENVNFTFFELKDSMPVCLFELFSTSLEPQCKCKPTFAQIFIEYELLSCLNEGEILSNTVI